VTDGSKFMGFIKKKVEQDNCPNDLEKKILLQLCQGCCKLGAISYYPVTSIIAILSYDLFIVKKRACARALLLVGVKLRTPLVPLIPFLHPYLQSAE
jgi:hypothetical protein